MLSFLTVENEISEYVVSNDYKSDEIVKIGISNDKIILTPVKSALAT